MEGMKASISERSHTIRMVGCGLRRAMAPAEPVAPLLASKVLADVGWRPRWLAAGTIAVRFDMGS